jgi:predicted nucleic acid-binding protein
MYLAHPVLHELWIGAKGKREQDHLKRFARAFIKVKRLIIPESSTQVKIGSVCNTLYHSGKLNPKHPKIYNDVCIALLTRQIGATLLTRNLYDFRSIREVIDFKYREAQP